MSQDISTNEYGFQEVTQTPQVSDMVQIEQARAIQESQASFVMAQKFPRNVNQSYLNIMTACDRIKLAEMSFYAYPKGGKTVTGASIRLAEVIAQNWGHIRTGVVELNRHNGSSTCKAYAWDVQSGYYDEKIFTVNHIIDTKKGPKKLTEEREIYELIANMGARRKRACIFTVVPGDILEAAEERCKKTMLGSKEPLADRIRKLITAFSEFGITIPQIEKRLGHNIDATIVEEVITLGGIYKSIKDGMADRSQFFDMGSASPANTSVKKLIESKKVDNVSDKVDKETGEVVNVEFEKVKNQLMNAKDIDTLSVAADLINSVSTTADENDELTAIYNTRKIDFK